MVASTPPPPPPPPPPPSSVHSDAPIEGVKTHQENGTRNHRDG